MEINLFRIAQEAINNSIKHSGGSQADIMLTEKNGRLEFVIRDNGKGFTQEKNETMAGNGLNNIYSRVNFLKGEVAVNSGDGVGTEYFISIPLRRKALCLRS
jgi:signal transduction histidine kinase